MQWLEESGALDGVKDQDNDSDTANEKSPDGEADSTERTENDSATNGVSRDDRGQPAGKTGAAGRATKGSGKRPSLRTTKARKGTTSGRRPVPMSERADRKAEGKTSDDDGVEQAEDGDVEGDTGDKVESRKEKKRTDESDVEKKKTEAIDDSDEAKDDD